MSQIGDYEETIEVVPNFLPVPERKDVTEPVAIPAEPEKVPTKSHYYYNNSKPTIVIDSVSELFNQNLERG